ncbi:GntR family transcriptional regulator [Psychrobacter urativorans]|uniref:GntR family transcriptional regulator n=1 Tax=Psychrobacter urativorans TaxID=45610 RepID=A0A0M4TTP9_9GAMM|nr:GntR family transcriptional regulator [Psychrobacter urativorans]ALF58786.1 GntR family transcriptional regulator [Psychrobacter urativorans]
MIETLQKYKVPRYEQVRWQIQKLLTEGRWDKTTPLPTEQELAERYEVSVGTVRKAVEKLVEDGILFKQQGKGTFLKQPNFEHSLSRFFKFRDKDSAYVTPIGVIKKIAEIPALEHINEKLKQDKNATLIYLERVRIINDKIIVSEKIWLPKSRFEPLITLDSNEFGSLLYPFYYKKCGQFVFSATETLFFIKDHADYYLKNSEHEPLVKVCRIAKNLNGEPIEYRESYGLAEHFSYEISIN